MTSTAQASTGSTRRRSSLQDAPSAAHSPGPGTVMPPGSDASAAGAVASALPYSPRTVPHNVAGSDDPFHALAGLDLAIEHRGVEELIPYAGNARTHSDAQVGQIAGSIRAFGWTNPVLVDGDNGVIAGHGRLLAARKLGLATVPVIELAGLSETRKRAYVLADNKLALNAGWDEAMLAAEVTDLAALGCDLALAGFDAAEVDELLGRDGEGSFPDEAPALPASPITRRGDLWRLREHRVLCGDATKPDDLASVLEGGLADLAFTDPPYNVDYVGTSGRRIANDALGDTFGAFLEAACRALLAVTKGAIYVCMSSSELDTLKRAFEAGGGHWSTFIIWAKPAFTLGRSDYQRQYEPILYGWPKGSQHYWCGARDQGDVWEIARPARNDLHPTMKPIALVERAIRNSSKRRDTVLDPFGGSGTTLMACEATGRQARLVELDPAYCDVIVERWQTATGGTATRQDTMSFAALKNARDKAKGTQHHVQESGQGTRSDREAATAARVAGEGA